MDPLADIIERCSGNLRKKVKRCLQECSPKRVIDWCRLPDVKPAYDCESWSQCVGEELNKVGIACVVHQGSVMFKGDWIFPGGSKYWHQWVEMLGSGGIVDLTVGYHLAARCKISRPLPTEWTPYWSERTFVSELIHRAEYKWSWGKGRWGDKTPI